MLQILEAILFSSQQKITKTTQPFSFYLTKFKTQTPLANVIIHPHHLTPIIQEFMRNSTYLAISSHNLTYGNLLTGKTLNHIPNFITLTSKINQQLRKRKER